MCVKRSYVVFIVGDYYLPGVLALKRSLDSVGSAFPLTALVYECSSETLRALSECGIEIIQAFLPDVSRGIVELNIAHDRKNWNNSFAKLGVLALTQFDTVVMLDGDMMVCKNIDHLFDAPSMSAVVAGQGLNPTWVDLNSGLMVIKPSMRLYDEALALLSEIGMTDLADFPRGIGDQDILKMLLDGWAQDDHLHLPEAYNAYYNYLAAYEASGYLPFRDVSVVHFELSPKPWAYGLKQWVKVFLRAVKHGSFVEFRALRRYMELLP